MKLISALTAGAALLIATSAMAAGLKTYQATGQVLEVTNDAVVIQKGKEKWEIAKDQGTKISGDLKAGSKATVPYPMKAATIEAKAEAKKEAKKK